LMVRLPLVGNIVHIHDVFITAALPLLLVFVAAGGTMPSSAGSRVAYAVAAITGLVTLLLLAFVRMSARDNGFEPWAVALAMPLTVALPLCWSVVRIGAGYRVPAIAATMLAGIILLLPSGLHARTGIVPVDQLLIQPRPRTALTGTSPAVDAVHRSASAPARAVGLDMTLFSGSQALYDLEGIGGADPLDVARYRELIDASGIFRSMVWFTTVTPADIGRLAPLLDLLNVAFVLHPGTVALSSVNDVPMAAPDRLKVARRSSAWPRAFFVSGLSTYTDARDLLEKVSAARQPFAAVQLGDNATLNVTGSATFPWDKTNGAPVPASGYRTSANTTSFTVRTSGGGVAVLHETYLDRDFRATLNGRDVPYFRVNHAFKAVLIPSGGEWTVRYEYRPSGWGLSLALAGMGILLLAGFVAWNHRAGVQP
jgi:hypothetical protein